MPRSRAPRACSPAAPPRRAICAAARAPRAFIRTTLWSDAEQRLLRRYRDGDAAIDGYAEDYAYLIFGLLELFQADGDPAWLDWATTLQARQDELFWDEQDGGWFSTTGQRSDACCCVSRRTTTAPSRRPARCRC